MWRTCELNPRLSACKTDTLPLWRVQPWPISAHFLPYEREPCTPCGGDRSWTHEFQHAKPDTLPLSYTPRVKETGHGPFLVSSPPQIVGWPSVLLMRYWSFGTGTELGFQYFVKERSKEGMDLSDATKHSFLVNSEGVTVTFNQSFLGNVAVKY